MTRPPPCRFKSRYFQTKGFINSSEALLNKEQNDSASVLKPQEFKTNQAHSVSQSKPTLQQLPTALSHEDKVKAREEKSRGKRIVAGGTEARFGPALYNQFAALNSLEGIGC